MKKILLIAFYFNQVNEIASKRLRGLAEYLPNFDYEPIVIVPDLGFSPEENLDLDCRIITTDYEDMFSHYLSKFKSPSKNISSSNGSWSSSASGDLDSSNVSNGSGSSSASGDLDSGQDKLRDSSSVENPILSKAISMAGEVFAYPDGMKYWFEPAFKKACEICDSEDIVAVISSSWPITCHIIAKAIKEKYDIPWIADLRDLWNLNPYVSHTAIREHFEKNLEQKTFRNVDVLTVTTDLAAETLATLHPDKRIVPILSGYSEEDFRIIDEVLSQNEGALENNKLKFIYAGSLYSGKRDPTLLFKGISELEEDSRIDSSKIAIEFYGDSGNLLEIAKEYGLSDILTIGGRVPHKTVLKKEADSDVLLLISWNNENEKMFIPGKIYEYFALKKPVLSIGYKEGSLKDLIDDTGIGYHVSTLEETKEALLDYYNEFIEKGHLDLNSDLNIEDYSMETMSSKFAALLDELT